MCCLEPFTEHTLFKDNGRRGPWGRRVRWGVVCKAKGKLLSDHPEACVTGIAAFCPLSDWKKEKVMCEERWGKERNRLGKRGC